MQVRAVHQCDEDGPVLADHGHDPWFQPGLHDQRLRAGESGQAQEAHDHHGQHE